VDGPKGGGHRFDPSIVLLDPAATALSGGTVWGQCNESGRSRSGAMLSRPTATQSETLVGRGRENMPPLTSLFFRRSFDWREDVPPRIPLTDSIIYELHVRGFTCHP